MYWSLTNTVLSLIHKWFEKITNTDFPHDINMTNIVFPTNIVGLVLLVPHPAPP